MPFDQFTIEQLAGDLLPGAPAEQKLATGFNRNHMINGEGGRIAEENRVDYVMDMAETAGTVWLGLTFNCCRCHDHKFDPLTPARLLRPLRLLQPDARQRRRRQPPDPARARCSPRPSRSRSSPRWSEA